MGNSHPKGLYLLFSVEMWERFSYYGMRALLMLYMMKSLQFTTAEAGKVYGWYTGLVYFTPLIGGYLADRYMGARACVFTGCILMALGHFAMAFPELPYFYAALGLLVLGNGFFKPNISTIVGQLYDKNDPKRDGGFTIFYMGINVGAFLAPFICGTLGEKVGWHWGFGAAGVGMLIGLGCYMWGAKRLLGNHGLAPTRTAQERKSDAPLTLVEKQRILAIFVFCFFAFFWRAIFEQAGSSLTIFADKQTDRTIEWLNWTFPTSYFQSINPLLIFILAPMFSTLWQRLARQGRNPSIPVKFSIGLSLLALGFVLMIVAGSVSAEFGTVSAFWLVTVYLFHTLGELCFSPVGLSMVSKLSPAKFVSLLMGTWYLSSFPANYIGGLFAGKYGTMHPAQFFMIPAATAAGAALLLFLIARPLVRWMHEDKFELPAKEEAQPEVFSVARPAVAES